MNIQEAVDVVKAGYEQVNEFPTDWDLWSDAVAIAERYGFDLATVLAELERNIIHIPFVEDVPEDETTLREDIFLCSDDYAGMEVHC